MEKGERERTNQESEKAGVMMKDVENEIKR